MTDATRSEQPLTPVVFHVLLSLSEGPLHGYAIMKRVESASGMRMGPGTVYGSLRRLTQAGWVRQSTAPEEASDPRRGKAFELTSDGARALAAEASRITHLAGLDRVRAVVADGTA